MGIIRRLWAGERLTHDGTHYQLMDAHLYDRPDRLPPIHIAASGAQSAELAGRHGDGLTPMPRAPRHPSCARRSLPVHARRAGIRSH